MPLCIPSSGKETGSATHFHWVRTKAGRAGWLPVVSRLWGKEQKNKNNPSLFCQLKLQRDLTGSLLSSCEKFSWEQQVEAAVWVSFSLAAKELKLEAVSAAFLALSIQGTQCFISRRFLLLFPSTHTNIVMSLCPQRETHFPQH